MWIYLPSECLVSAPESKESVSGLESLDEYSALNISQSVTWRTKRMRVQYWQSRWKRGDYIQRLFGPTLLRSQKLLTASVAKWILSLPVTRASLSVQQGEEKAPEMSGTFGRIFCELSRQSILPGFSAKTFPDTSPLDSMKWSEAFTVWTTRLRQESTQRLNLVRRISGNGCSSWPMPRNSPQEARTTKTTPSQEKGEHGRYLSAEAGAWATPAARDWKSDNPEQSPDHAPPLGRQVLKGIGPASQKNSGQQWQTPRGSDGEKGGPNQALKGKPALASQAAVENRRLNPQFVEWLQNFPIGWSDVDATELIDWQYWETQSSQLVQQWLSLI